MTETITLSVDLWVPLIIIMVLHIPAWIAALACCITLIRRPNRLTVTMRRPNGHRHG